MHTNRRWLAVPAVFLSAGAIAACGSSSSSSSSTSSASSSASSSSSTPATTPSASGANAAVAALVPAAIKSKGTLTIASDASYPPDESIGPDGHTVVGWDVDLIKALGALMGLKVNVQNITFDSIIPGLAAGKYDMGVSSFGDTKKREATVDFVDYFQAGESFYTKAQGGVSIGSIADICGKTISVEKGTTEEADAGTQGTKCKAAGKPGVTVLSFPDQNGANLAVSSGRAQLGFSDTPVAAYQVKKTGGQFKLVGAAYAVVPYGFAIPKNSGLGPPLVAALKALMASGGYTSILTKWGVEAGAVPASAVKINGAVS
jgi:polar amino acid transport system substrate-binding protein